MQIKTTLLYDGARLPQRGHDIDVGLDVFTPKAGVLYPGPNKIPLGFSIEVPVGYSASIYPRTGMVSGEKVKDLTVRNTGARVGNIAIHPVSIEATLPPIDPGYTGEVHAIVLNHSNLTIEYPQHTRFGQLVVHPIAYAVPVVAVDKSRGDGAFGSTGA